jgi:hypothetical protein
VGLVLLCEAVVNEENLSDGVVQNRIYLYNNDEGWDKKGTHRMYEGLFGGS